MSPKLRYTFVDHADQQQVHCARETLRYPPTPPGPFCDDGVMASNVSESSSHNRPTAGGSSCSRQPRARRRWPPSPSASRRRGAGALDWTPGGLGSPVDERGRSRQPGSNGLDVRMTLHAAGWRQHRGEQIPPGRSRAAFLTPMHLRGVTVQPSCSMGPQKATI